VHVERDAKRGVWEFTAYTGKITVHVEAATNASRFAPRNASGLEIHPGNNEITVRLYAAMGARVRAIDKVSKEAVGTDWQDTFYASIEAIDHDGAVGNSPMSSGMHTLYVDKPGKYRIRLSPPDGYKRPKNKIVTIEKGKFFDVTFELEKN
jgi:hypothetical protein